MPYYPFVLYMRKNSPYFFVKFKTDEGTYTSGRTTKETSRQRAEKTAMRMYMSGEWRERRETERRKTIKSLIRESDIGDDVVSLVLDELKRRGVVSKVILAESKEAVSAMDYARNFWDWEKSPYIAEKLRQGHSIHKSYAEQMRRALERYWAERIGDKMLGEVSRADFDGMMETLSKTALSGHTKNVIVRSLSTVVRYAADNGILPEDATRGLVFFADAYKKRDILTLESARAVFRVEWKSEKARLANLVAMLTGMRGGEIRALRPEDLGDDRIEVRHSWNDREGLKSTKNGEERTVSFPFPEVIAAMRRLYAESPWSDGREQFIFWANVPNKPVEQSVLKEGLTDALVRTGMSAERAARYVFHSWRHFFATYMSDRLNARLLMSQTGHKTRAMLDHYADHGTDESLCEVRRAQTDFFSGIVGD